MTTTDPSVFERIGGQPAVDAAVDMLYLRILADPDLAPIFDGYDVEQIKAHQRVFIAVAVGGPGVYGGRSMAAAHGALRITDAEFDRVVAHIGATLDALGVDAALVGRISETVAPLRGDIVTA